MYINQTFELSMVLDSEKFHNILARACDKTDYMEKNENEYVDHSLDAKGITVIYRDSQYKKKARILANMGMAAGDSISDPEKFIQKLDKRIRKYFVYKYAMNDFSLSGVTFTTDINVGDREKVSSYLKVFKRIGKVKGFSPVSYKCFGEDTSFCLEGNSNGVDFMIYDLGSVLMEQLKETQCNRKELKSTVKRSEGILRSEVRLAEPKAVRVYTKADGPSEQIRELVEGSKEVFMDIFAQTIPFGDFYKKNEAVEIIREQVQDSVMRRKMLGLLTLIPERKSLYLAQKAMNCRNMEKIMEAFAEINVSPVTISKRHDIKNLECIYKHLVDEKQ